jgi:predicted NBD/HSP70 family sugar kinase
VAAIIRRAAELAGVEDAEDLPRDVELLRERLGDGPVATALREAGTYLGVVLANLVATVDVTHIVLSPELEGDVGHLTDAVRSAMSERLLPGHADGVELRVSTLGPDLVLHGAHALVLAGALGLVGIGPAAAEDMVAPGDPAR